MHKCVETGSRYGENREKVITMGQVRGGLDQNQGSEDGTKWVDSRAI